MVENPKRSTVVASVLIQAGLVSGPIPIAKYPIFIFSLRYVRVSVDAARCAYSLAGQPGRII